MNSNTSYIVIEGITAVSAVIKAVQAGISNRNIYRLCISSSARQKKMREIAFFNRCSASMGFSVDFLPDCELEDIVSGNSHGGIVALCSERMFGSVNAANLPSNGIFALLDGVEDPYNYAYAVRSLYASGFDGIVLPPRNWTCADSLVCKSSAGTSELFPTFVEDPIEAVKKFKSAGYKILCAGIRDSVSLYDADLKAPLLLIIGGEKRGISRSLLDIADQIVRIDYGRDFMGSLTTAASAAVMAFEIMRVNK